jgi:hypothetical protein
MQVYRFLIIAAVAAVTLDTAASARQEDATTSEEVSNDALDVILGASSVAGSVIAGATDTIGSATGSSGACSVATAGVFATAFAVAAAALV